MPRHLHIPLLCLLCFLWLKPTLHSAPEPNLTVLTYNVLAHPWKTEQRIPALFAQLAASDADVIALQEVAPWFAEKLSHEPWLANYHYPKTETGLPAIAHEFIILTKAKPTSRQTLALPSTQSRTAFLTTIPLGNSNLTLATVHLDSFLKDGPNRARQLNTIFKALETSPHAILLGDLNFGDGEQPDTDAIPSSYQDPWLTLRPNAPGYTWNRELNQKARIDSFPGEPSRRLDRILIRSDKLWPKKIELFGDEPIAPRKPYLYPSDHFGLICVFSPFPNSTSDN